jgi:bifunctional N-acetylglucosamine-1-phosphate-uridyltransferase/glucosamine-1-phosphate-acetyltransferase GlmU-like protein
VSDNGDNAATPDDRRPLAAVILAAGKGTRMPGDRPKVTFAVGGRPMICWVVDAVRAAGARPIVLVIGYGADAVRAVFAGADDVVFAVQAEQLGTAHATGCAASALKDFAGDVLVLAGDGPLIRADTIQTLVQRHRASGAAATLATAAVDDPTGYGRIVRDASGGFRAIVEHASATEDERRIREIYPSYACYDAALLFSLLEGLVPDAASGEYRITDLPQLLLERGHAVELVDGFPPEDVLSINTIQQLEQVDAVLSSRTEGRR